MAGERLVELINSQGGADSNYADVVYGVVIAVSPLKIQLSNSMVLDDDFIVLGKHIGKFKLKGKQKITSGDRSGTTENVEYEFDNSLRKDDKVTMIRSHGGQKFYLWEREEAE